MLFRLLTLCLLFFSQSHADVHRVSNPKELKAALPLLKDGDTLRISEGTYPGGNAVRDIRDLTIEGESPETPPLFEGGKEAWHFTSTPGLTFRHINLRGQSSNGLNIDDGGNRDHPVESVLLEHIRIEDIGPMGNFDGVKCTGLKGLTIRDCSVNGWGGQAIDLVGCREVLITGCRITGKAEGFSQRAGLQIKGGSENVIVEKCKLINAGARPVQFGGSTGDAFFRPPEAKFEAKNITARKNLIEGGECAAAFTGVNGGQFVNNTIRFPDKWIFRVLWEKRAGGFSSTSGVTISNNEILYRRSDVTHAFNISENCSLDTFKIEDNTWLAEDMPEKSKPVIPGISKSLP